MKHKHAEVIKAFADGIECEYFDGLINSWEKIEDLNDFICFHIVRIKPQPKEDTVRYICILNGYIGPQSDYMFYSDNLKLIFDGETGKLKSAEVI
jgi:hypothetical protein